MTPYEKPRLRKGHVLTAVAWNRDGTVRSATYRPQRANDQQGDRE